MFIIKLKHHISAIVTQIVYKIIYGSRFKVGKGTTWRKNLSIMIDKGGKIYIGKDCFFNNYCSLNANEGITIGDNSIFGENVKIYDHNHRFSDRSKLVKEQGFSNEKVVIGSNCWIGSNVTILKGTQVGNGCVVGAGTVVSGTVPDNTIVRMERELVFEAIKSKS